MTGSYPIRNGPQTGSWHPVLMLGDTQGIHADEITIAGVLQKQGYATGTIGKLHLGCQPKFPPELSRVRLSLRAAVLQRHEPFHASQPA